MGLFNNKLALCLITLFIGGAGGVAPDFDHLLNQITNGQVPWTFLHTATITQFLFGGIITLIGGLLLSLFLGRKVGWK